MKKNRLENILNA